MAICYKDAFSFILFFCSVTVVLGQTTEIERLLKEREVLMKDYSFYASQKSNFWGKQSKKDILKITEVLKKIISNDADLIAEYRKHELTKTATIKVENKKLEKQVYQDREIINNQINDLQYQLKAAENKLKAKERIVAETEQLVELQKKQNNILEQLLFVLLIILLALGVYTARVRASKKSYD